MSGIVYTPSPSVVPFLCSDKFQSFIIGCVGSTKTTASIMKIVYEAKRICPARDGIRHSRYAVIRNTRQMLWDTTIPDFLTWFPEGQAGSLARTDSRYIMRFDDVECEVLFRGLDDANDVRRLLSLQLTGAMLDETREISKDVFQILTSRLGRYPNGMMVPHRPQWGVDDKGFPIQGCVDEQGRPMKRIWGASNPADLDSFWEDYWSNPPENCHVTIQPSGLSPEADWLQYLPSGYYEDMMQGKSEDWIDVYVHGKWGKSLSGQPVFRSFKLDYHVSPTPLRHISSDMYPLIVSVDFCLTPAAVISQVVPDGRFITYADPIAENMGAVRFINEKLKPLLSTRFPNCRSICVGDPAGQQRAQSDERSVFDMFKAAGFRMVPARTNSISARIGAVDQWLTRNVDGKPACLIDPGCTSLIAALRGKYRYRLKTNNELDDTPDKNHPWSDIADAFQYGCLHADGGKLFGANNVNAKREVKRVEYVY